MFVVKGHIDSWWWLPWIWDFGEYIFYSDYFGFELIRTKPTAYERAWGGLQKNFEDFELFLQTFILYILCYILYIHVLLYIGNIWEYPPPPPPPQDCEFVMVWWDPARCSTTNRTLVLTPSLPSSKSAFSNLLKINVRWREVGSGIIFHLSRVWRASFSILCDVILLVRLQENFEIDHF